MAFIDYYKILGVSKDIPQKDVKAAYRKRAKQFHPDLHPNDPKAKAKFQALNEAYAVISDPDKRAKYDKYGERWRDAEAFERAGGSAGGGAGGFSGFGGAGGDPFSGFDFTNFGSSGFSSFFEDLFGHAGTGSTSHRSYSFNTGGNSYGFNSGAGGNYGFGTGARQSTGQMNATVNIDLYTALLGGDIMIQLSNGKKIKLKIKPCTQNGTKVRLRGNGYDRGDGTFGDLIITYHVTLPTQLNERQRELLREMKEAQ